jgi:thiol-disulfide isomerase/thioredoxin
LFPRDGGLRRAGFVAFLSAMKRFIRLCSALGLLVSAAFAAVHVKQAEPLHVSEGQEIALTDFLVPGKTVVFDFTSKYCGPCQAYNEPLKLLHARRADIVVVKVDINRPDIRGIDWQSPVARQYDLHSIPHFKVYSPQGKLVAEDKIVFGPDGRPDRALSSSAARQAVDKYINALGQ